MEQFESFIKLVEQMRNCQRDYFQTRSYHSLKQYKQLEHRVDEVIADYHHTQASDHTLQLAFNFD